MSNLIDLALIVSSLDTHTHTLSPSSFAFLYSMPHTCIHTTIHCQVISYLFFSLSFFIFLLPGSGDSGGSVSNYPRNAPFDF